MMWNLPRITSHNRNYSGTLSAADVLVRRSEVGAGGLGR
jgi:hypothetical protein